MNESGEIRKVTKIVSKTYINELINFLLEECFIKIIKK
jgi:hypothetical protein